MCPFPNEALPGVTGQHLIKQFDASFERDDISQYEMVTLFCNGNFFNDQEIPAEVRSHMFRRCRDAGVKYVTVESLPQFITPARVAQAKEDLGEAVMTVFIGFQSSNDIIRNVAVNTTCTREAFEAAHRLLDSYGYHVASFLMVKPPFVTEAEAVDDVVSSVEYLASIGVKYATLCPMRVAPLTVAERMYQRGLYRPAKIWSTVDALRRTHWIEGVTVMVNTTELKSEMNTDSVCVDECPHCTPVIIDAIERYLFTRDWATLFEFDTGCGCCAEYFSLLVSDVDPRPLEQRVIDYIELENA
jgi:radical SAM enzyme (TIGR01210 family)